MFIKRGDPQKIVIIEQDENDPKIKKALKELSEEAVKKAIAEDDNGKEAIN
jgi:hypothetical protein